MAYDAELVERIRAVLAPGTAFTEKRMFGGDAFLIGGHMAVAASGHGSLVVRVDPAESDALVARPGVERMVMGTRELDGWLRVALAELDSVDVLRDWVARGVAFVATLPAT